MCSERLQLKAGSAEGPGRRAEGVYCYQSLCAGLRVSPLHVWAAGRAAAGALGRQNSRPSPSPGQVTKLL